MSLGQTRAGFFFRSAIALAVAAGCAGLLRPVVMASPERLDAQAVSGEWPVLQSGARIVQHGGYPELQVAGKPFFINSVEFPYPRVPRNLWQSSLERYHELGINTITLTIPWNWHEPVENQLDFDGHSNSRRDLHALLKLVADQGFKLIVRAGPTVGDDWRNGGYPDWLLERPEYAMPLADRLEGLEPPAAALASSDADAAARDWLKNTTHMEHARLWLAAVARELAPFLAAQLVNREPDNAKARGAPKDTSGPLLFVQVENGFSTAGAKPARSDFWRYTEALCGFLAEAGITAPCFIDLTSSHSAAGRSTLASPVAAMGAWLPGPAIGDGGEDPRITPARLAELEFTVASMATQPAFPPLLARFNAGWFAPGEDARPELRPVEVIRTSAHLLIGFGLRGLCWYPLQDSLTPQGFGTPNSNRYYRWDAGLTLNGAKEPAAREVQRIGDWLRNWGSQLAASHLRTDFGLVDLRASLAGEQLTGDDAVAIIHTAQQLVRLAQYEGMSSELVDPEHQPVDELLRHPLLLLPAYKPEDPEFALTEKAQRALEAYVRGGGVLVCFPGRPAGAVMEAMDQGPALESGDLPAGSLVRRVGVGRLIVLTKDFYSWVSLREEIGEGQKRFEAPYARSLLEAVLKTAGVRQCVRRESVKAETSNLVITELVSNEGSLPLGDRSGGQAWLSVVNRDREAAVRDTLHVLSPRASARLEKTGTDDWIEVPVNLPPRESLLLPIDVSLCLEPAPHAECEDSVTSSGAELVRADREGKSMFLSFYSPARAALSLHLAQRPDQLEVDEAQTDARWTKASKKLDAELLRGASPQFLRVLRVPLPYAPALRERPKTDSRHPSPARFRFSPSGAVRLPLGEDANLLTNPPLFVFRRESEASMWLVAENLGGQSGSVQVQATGPFNTSARAYVAGNELRSVNLKLPAATVEKAALEPPAADGLYHGTLHFSAGLDSTDMPVSYAILPAKGAARYQFDFARSGSDERVLENGAARAIFSPSEGGRIVALVAKSSERALSSTMGLLEDTFSFAPGPLEIRHQRARGRAGTFNRTYSAEWISGTGGPALALRYAAPDVYPHGARLEKTASFAEDRTLAVEYRVSLLSADAQRQREEAEDEIFGTPLPAQPVPQSLVILNSVPASVNGARRTHFCWKNPEAGTTGAAGAEHCERFVPGGAPISPPAGVRQIEIRDAGNPGLAFNWEDSGARLTLEPRNYSVLLKLAFPPLDPGGATAIYRIEFSVREAQ